MQEKRFPVCTASILKISQLDNGVTLIEIMLAIAIVSIVSMIAVPSYQAYVRRVENAIVISKMELIEQTIERFSIVFDRLPSDLTELGPVPLDSWGNPYEYLNISLVKGKGKGKLRKDHNLVPLNTDYDLYSKGADGKSQSPLTAKASRDDIIRANNGAFLGPASDY